MKRYKNNNNFGNFVTSIEDPNPTPQIAPG